MLDRVISGGQSGAARAGWRAAKAAGISTGGAMPHGFQAKDGQHPEFAAEFGAHELPYFGYSVRTKVNVEGADGTLWFGSPDSPGDQLALEWCRALKKPFLVVPLSAVMVSPSYVATWITDKKIKTLNVAAREGKALAIGARVEAFLTRVFAITQRAGPDPAT
jgi:hypothetical protein